MTAMASYRATASAVWPATRCRSPSFAWTFRSVGSVAAIAALPPRRLSLGYNPAVMMDEPRFVRFVSARYHALRGLQTVAVGAAALIALPLLTREWTPATACVAD